MVLSALSPTTAGEVFSTIEAKALPMRRKVSMLFVSCAKAGSDDTKNKTIKKVEIKR